MRPTLSLCEQRRGWSLLVLGVVGDAQRLNLAEELLAFGVIGGELVVKFVEPVDLAAEDFAADAVSFGAVVVSLHEKLSCGSVHT
jgi:hypothetical protein